MGKTIVYQMLPRLWGNNTENPDKNGDLERNGCGKFQNIDIQTLEYLKTLGVSHLWCTGIIRHATKASTSGCEPSHPDWVKGEAGSPYSITDYFDVNPYLAVHPEKRMKEFEDLADRVHDAGLKLIIDFVPNHVARDYGKFSPRPFKDGLDAKGHPVFGSKDDKDRLWAESNDFFYYPGQELRLPVKGQKYKEIPAMASGNCYSPEPVETDWYDTIKINYCDYHTETWDKMREVLRFWIKKGVDGFRCDMVELVPQAFLSWLIAKIKEEFPETIFIAEIYQKASYSQYIRDAGFDFLYDKSGLYDALHDISVANVEDKDMPVEMWQSAKRITWNWQSIGDLQPYMLNFLENHDELRFASDFFGKKAENAFAALGVSLFFNTSAFMLYFGQEIGERGMEEEGFSGLNGRTSIFDWCNPDGIRRLYNTIHGRDELSVEERRVLNKYKKALSFAAESPVVCSGETYDLCYFNLGSEGFNPDRHFAFLRNFKKESLLYVCNFSKKEAEIEILIPDHAFEWLCIPQTEAFNSRTPIKLFVEPMSYSQIRLY